MILAPTRMRARARHSSCNSYSTPLKNLLEGGYRTAAAMVRFIWREVGRMLRTVTQEKIHKAIAKIFLAYGKPQAERIKVYEEILAGLPIRIVEEACDYAVKGKLGKPTFMPNPGELYQLGQELLTREYCKAKQERERRYQEPDHKTTPQQRERMAARFRELVHD